MMATILLHRPLLPRGTTLLIQQILSPSPYLTSSSPLPSFVTSSSSSAARLPTTQARNATFIKQPRRPYMFTQLVQLSDGSMFTCRTTSPQSLYRSQKDKMNNILWQPTNKSLHNVELDEAGKLAAFRERFGRQWDIAKPKEKDAAVPVAAIPAAAAAEEAAQQEPAKEDLASFYEDFSMAELLKDYADQSGQDFTAVKGGGRKKKSKK